MHRNLSSFANTVCVCTEQTIASLQCQVCPKGLKSPSLARTQVHSTTYLLLQNCLLLRRASCVLKKSQHLGRQAFLSIENTKSCFTYLLSMDPLHPVYRMCDPQLASRIFVFSHERIVHFSCKQKLLRIILNWNIKIQEFH